jgi:hypothetical protein
MMRIIESTLLSCKLEAFKPDISYAARNAAVSAHGLISILERKPSFVVLFSAIFLQRALTAPCASP